MDGEILFVRILFIRRQGHPYLHMERYIFDINDALLLVFKHLKGFYYFQHLSLVLYIMEFVQLEVIHKQKQELVPSGPQIRSNCVQDL